MTKKHLEELREKVKSVEWLNREEQDEMFREVDQLLRDNQALADGLNDWRDKAEAFQRTLNILAEHEPSWSDDFLRARASLGGASTKKTGSAP